MKSFYKLVLCTLLLSLVCGSQANADYVFNLKSFAGVQDENDVVGTITVDSTGLTLSNTWQDIDPGLLQFNVTAEFNYLGNAHSINISSANNASISTDGGTLIEISTQGLRVTGLLGFEYAPVAPPYSFDPNTPYGGLIYDNQDPNGTYALRGFEDQGGFTPIDLWTISELDGGFPFATTGGWVIADLSAVPEPSTISLLSLGGLAALARKFWTKIVDFVSGVFPSLTAKSA